MKLINLLLAFNLFVYSSISSGGTYIVRAGDNLSQITIKLVGNPVYGAGNNLEKIIKLNSWIKNPNLIYPGKVIYFEDQRLAKKSPSPEPVDTVTPPEPENIPAPAETIYYKYVEGCPSLNPNVFFSRIDATDTGTAASATLVSSMAYGIAVSCVQEWSDKIKIYEELGVNRIEFTDNVRGTGSIENASLDLYNLGLSAEYIFSDYINIIGKLSYGQEVYSHGRTSAVGVVLDAVAAPSVQTAAKFTLVEKNEYVLSSLVGTKLLFPTSTSDYETKAGTGIIAKLIVEQATVKYNYSYDLFYHYQVQNSSIADYIRRDVGVNLKLNWK